MIFTAGVGENAPKVRRDVCDRLAWLGVLLDDEANQQNAGKISGKLTHPRVYVVPTDEERMIATHALRLVGASAVA